MSLNMPHRFLAVAIVLALGGCAPNYVRGDAPSVETGLLKIVPIGSTLVQLRQEAQRRDWKVNEANIRPLPVGSVTWIDNCKGRGGPMAPILIADYGWPFTTSVESTWIFDDQGKLAGVCVRKTVDAL